MGERCPSPMLQGQVGHDSQAQALETETSGVLPPPANGWHVASLKRICTGWGTWAPDIRAPSTGPSPSAPSQQGLQEAWHSLLHGTGGGAHRGFVAT